MLNNLSGTSLLKMAFISCCFLSDLLCRTQPEFSKHHSLASQQMTNLLEFNILSVTTSMHVLHVFCHMCKNFFLL